MAANVIEIEENIRRSRGRTGRTFSANAKVTKEEQSELETAAKNDGKALSEWAREVLLREARARHTDRALFTEVVALRTFLSTILRPVATGKTMTDETYAQLLEHTKNTKHTTAREVLEQYAGTGAK